MNVIDLSAIGLQILLPLALIGWLAFSPLHSRMGFLLQALATGCALFALLLSAVWMIPPWWVPFVYVTFWLVAVLGRGNNRLRASAWLPRTPSAWTAVVGFIALSVWAGSVIVSALAGRHPPSDTRVVDLEFPLGPGEYLVASGGGSAAVNGHFLTLHPTTERQRAYRGQSYAVDLIGLGSWGMRAPGWRPSDPAAYAIFGKTVFAPCDGTVIAAKDGMPDMPVPTTDTSRLEGNHVIVQCGDVAVLLAHFERDSVSVEVGDVVETGQPVGRVGNSGQSTEPHLHIHVQGIPDRGPMLSGDPYFLTFEGDFPVRNERWYVTTAPAARANSDSPSSR